MEPQIPYYRLYLREELARRCETNPRYSMRSFARKLNIHSGALSGIMNGKRRISRKMAERISVNLLLNPDEKFDFFKPFRNPSGASRSKKYRVLDLEQFRVISEWEHFAILSLIKIRGATGSIKWVSKMLRITEKKAQEAIDRLLSLGLIKESDKRFIRTWADLTTPDEISSIAIKKAHIEELELAKESLLSDPVERRDITSITMAIDPEKLAEAKKRIREFQDEISELLEEGEKKEVYKLNINLFPLTGDEGLYEA